MSESDGRDKIGSNINSGSGWLTMALTAAVAVGGFIAATMYETINTNSTHRIQAEVSLPDMLRRIELLEGELDRLRPRE